MRFTPGFYTTLGFALLSILPSVAQAQWDRPVYETDLSAPLIKSVRTTSGNLLKPDRVEDLAPASGLNLQFVRLVKGIETPISGLQFKAQTHRENRFQNYTSNANGVIQDSVCNQPSFTVSISLDSARYQVSSGSGSYQVLVNVKCNVAQKIVFEEKSDSGQALSIWQTATHAEQKLGQEVSLNFWKNKITFIWPAQGDYYSFGVVHISVGYQWDVVAHEMGHAIYDQANIGVFGGGEHYIDRCYGTEIALSEGWASFFSAWLNLDSHAVDPAFEYMVPRRAPVRVENIPNDVCDKSTNEWRVFGFLWDLVDEHDDGENFHASFGQLWQETAGAHASSASNLRDRLAAKGWNRAALDLIWKLNFPGE